VASPGSRAHPSFSVSCSSPKNAALSSRSGVGRYGKPAGKPANGMIMGWLSGRVSVNVSAAEFRHKHFVEGVRTILSEAGLAAQYLDLEFTEDVLMKGAEYTASVLPQLKAAGVHLAVDDFGSVIPILAISGSFQLIF